MAFNRHEDNYRSVVNYWNDYVDHGLADPDDVQAKLLFFTGAVAMKRVLLDATAELAGDERVKVLSTALSESERVLVELLLEEGVLGPDDCLNDSPDEG